MSETPDFMQIFSVFQKLTFTDSGFNNSSSVNQSLAVMLTEFVENTVNTRSLEISKTVTGNTTATSFNFTLQLDDVFGTDVDVGDYTGITYTKSDPTETGTLCAGGTFSLQAGQSITIAGIPYGTHYTVTEDISGLNPQPTVTGLVTDEALTTDKTGQLAVAVTNTFPENIPITVTKTGTTGDDLSGAELELWYKETTTPPTYSLNDPQAVPSKINGMSVSKSANQIGVPGLEESSSSYTYYTDGSPLYSNPAVPAATDTDWILPRNDTDYIYFRDYNAGTYTGEHDKPSFNNKADKDLTYNTNNNDLRTWRATNFALEADATTTKPGTHSQHLELDYDEDYWFAAEFSGPGKQTVKYAMWERFVDKYDSNTITTVWKIQPPDGYKYVRFMLLKGDTVVRKTELKEYKLGKIYHKTSWGGYWTSKDGLDCYYDVPIVAEETSGDMYWAPEGNSVTDKRMETSGTMSQARKYEPTERKIIFTCNSEQVWHNIHIEFFTTDTTDTTYSETVGSTTVYRVNGQAFPGYMMEPYAYAESNYRLRANGKERYLTYELTIPKGATHFRINNGIASGPYSYRTAITAIANDTNVKNGGNYYILGTSSNYSHSNETFSLYNCLSSGDAIHDIPLYKTTAPFTDLATGENINETYTNSDITTDYDYIYFESPNWNSGRIYAYFYGGGNLRDDNWQRACYSSWPGVAPEGTEYVTTGGTATNDNLTVHSNTYSISNNGSGANDTYNGKSTGGTLSPEATFELNGSTIYKFRIPKGDRKNYSKVVFNDGLSCNSGGNETGVIAYQPGYIYSVNGSPTLHYDTAAAITYTGRSPAGAGNTEYIYIKNTANWDDLHITFYDSNGNRILQSGKGYVMDYAGKRDGKEYYRMPIPEGAAKFSVNNGLGNSNSSKVTPKYDIIRYDTTTGQPKATAAAGDMFVYDLSGTTLTRLGYTAAGAPTAHTVTTATAQTETCSYTIRTEGSPANVEDTLNIRDDYNWNVPIGGVNVTFYGTNGAVVGGGVMMRTNPDSDNHRWYTKKIPTGAASFSVSYTKTVSNNPVTNTTDRYPIYSATADASGNVTTTGDMFYKTSGTNQLSMIYADAVSAPGELNDETYQKRGDDLYLVYDSKQSTAPTVTFYGGSSTIKSGVTVKSVHEQDGKHWYKVSIPKGADAFSIGSDTKYPIYELKTKLSRYEKDYTLGDMQYSVSGGNATLLYPKFTQDDEYTLVISNDKSITTRAGLIPIDESMIKEFANADVMTRTNTPTASAVTGQSPVLYETSNTDVMYNWTEGSSVPDNKLRFDNSGLGWDTVHAYFYDNNDNRKGAEWPGDPMTIATGDTSGYLSIDVPDGATKVNFNVGNNSNELEPVDTI